MVGHTPPTPEEYKIAMDKAFDTMAKVLMRRNAAEEMYEALKWMVENDDTNEGDEPLDYLGGKSWDEYNSYWIDGLNKARAAIAKAEGR